MLELFDSGLLQRVRLHSLFLCVWYLLCLIWEGLSSPCNKFNDFESWTYGIEALPCEAFEFVCTLLCMGNGSFIAGTILVHRLLLRLTRWPDRLPPQMRGLPQALLDTLPAFNFGDGLIDYRRRCV